MKNIKKCRLLIFLSSMLSVKYRMTSYAKFNIVAGKVRLLSADFAVCVLNIFTGNIFTGNLKTSLKKMLSSV